jgi:hypothetical protein
MKAAINSRFQPLPQAHAPHDPRRDEEIVRRYLDFLRRKNANWSLVSSLFSCVKTLLMSVFGILSLVSKIVDT